MVHHRLAVALTAIPLFTSGMSCAALAGTLHPSLVADPGPARSQLPFRAAIAFLSDRADVAELSRTLAARGAGRAERHRAITVALRDGAGHQRALLDRMTELRNAGEISGFTSYWITNAVAFTGTQRVLEEIAARADVKAVLPNFRPRLFSRVARARRSRANHSLAAGGSPDSGPFTGAGVAPGLRAINADRVWRELGITGAGRIVATLDSGADATHPALAPRWRGNQGAPPGSAWLDLLGAPSAVPSDASGHGTHVLGTLVGCDSATGDTIGVAFGASWIACNASGQAPTPDFTNDVYTAYQWFIDPDGDPGTADDVPDVIENSWGVSEILGYPDCVDLWWDAIDNAEAAGIVTIWTVGNYGPAPQTIVSPADRVTTPVVSFAVGAADATAEWPHPVADFSSRGPSGCDGTTLKPEVVAPGVSVYSSIPGGGYAQSGWDGTSMAGPHVAGIVALMREANPDLDPSTIKAILVETARDLDPPGPDNDSGAGFVDAFAAVLRAAADYGNVRGSVTHAVTSEPIPGARIEAVEAGRFFLSALDGTYRATLESGVYTLRVGHPAFQTATLSGVPVETGATSVADFSLDSDPTDVTTPAITDVVAPCASDGLAPIPVQATVADDREFVNAVLRGQGPAGPFAVPMHRTHGHRYEASIPATPESALVQFHLLAYDAAGNVVFHPSGAPADQPQIVIGTPSTVFDDDGESDNGWTLGLPGDGATDGFWERADPAGTSLDGEPAQSEDDHTPDPGTVCFVTGAGGGDAGSDDVDGGCTTLLSPIMDLSGSTDARLRYWRWFFDGGVFRDDTLFVDASSDSGGTWSTLERVYASANLWTEVTLHLCGLVAFTGGVQLRIRACDDPNNSICEAALDDVRIERFEPVAVAVGESPAATPGDPVAVTQLAAVSPNPIRNRADVVYTLAAPGDVSLRIFDATGRLVATLVEAYQPTGRYAVSWDGRDNHGERLASGVYFVRLRAPWATRTGRITIVF